MRTIIHKPTFNKKNSNKKNSITIILNTYQYCCNVYPTIITGKVKLAVHKDTGQRVAIKIIQKSKLTAAPSLRKKIEREIAVMKLFSHPHVIKLFDVLQTKQYLYVFDFANIPSSSE